MRFGWIITDNRNDYLISHTDLLYERHLTHTFRSIQKVAPSSGGELAIQTRYDK